MKKQLYILAILALLVGGCENGTPPGDGPVATNPTAPVQQPDQPIDDNPGAEEPDEGEGDNPPPEGTQPQAKKVGWYLRTTATVTSSSGNTYRHDTAGVFGELKESAEGKDRHDISSYGKAVLQIRFVNEEIAPGEEYYSDYRHYEGSDKKEVWTFIVKNETGEDLSNASLKLNVEQMRDVLKKKGDFHYIEKVATSGDKCNNLVLVDVDNQQTYNCTEISQIPLSMDGKHIRTFRWVLGSVEQKDMETLQNVSTQSTATQSVYAPRATDGSKFGLPPE